MYDYNPMQWTLIFYVYCVCGWLFESAVVSVQQRRLVNRGFLKGPMLPIYGFGATIMLHVSLPLMGHPVAIYFAGLVTATAFEYAVGVLMETLFKVKYWDYSEHKFQFQGRICLDSSIAWGFLSLLLAYVLHKPVADFITDLGTAPAAVLTLAVSVWFVYDTVTSVKAAFEFASVLEELEKMRAEAEELRVQLQLGVYEAQDRLEDARAQLQDIRAQLKDAQGDLRERLEAAQRELRASLETAQDELRERMAKNASRASAEQQSEHSARQRLEALEKALREGRERRERHYRALLRGNPSARSPRFGKLLHSWKDED